MTEESNAPLRRRVTGRLGWIIFEVGDLVTREGTDVHRVIRSDAIDDGQCIEVECVSAPETGWCNVGDTEVNMARRYMLIDPNDPTKFYDTPQ